MKKITAFIAICVGLYVTTGHTKVASAGPDAKNIVDLSDLLGVLHDFVGKADTTTKSKTFDTGACRVWVTETFLPQEPSVSFETISWPYVVNRPNQRYNCTDKKISSGQTTGAVEASVSSTVAVRMAWVQKPASMRDCTAGS